MDWFERLTGFRERSYDETRARLEVDGEVLRSRVNGAAYGIGRLSMPSLAELRAAAAQVGGLSGALATDVVRGDVGRLHRRPEYAGALVQVASQFNLLEMTGPSVTPEDGVTRYKDDLTQGPACAIAAGAATIYRTYFAPVRGEPGQTRSRQLDAAADLARALADALGTPVAQLWSMRNGYLLPEAPALKRIGVFIQSLSETEKDSLRSLLRVGVHEDIEVTDGVARPGPRVSQAFCSAVPVAYSDVAEDEWEPLGRLVLEAAYEATLWQAVLNAERTGNPHVLLTRLGGGAFGNPPAWIDDAIVRALSLARGRALQVRFVRRKRSGWGGRPRLRGS